MRTVVILLVCASGCGRISFDPIGPDSDGDMPSLVVTQDANNLELSVPGRFSMRFAETYDWYAVDWRDATNPDEALVALETSIDRLDRGVLQGMNVFPANSDYLTTGSGVNRTIEMLESDAAHVVFRATCELAMDADRIASQVVNRIDREGTWQITLSLSSLAGTADMDFLETADSHVNADLQWTQVEQLGAYVWRRVGPDLRATMRVSDGPTNQLPQDDEPNNLYFEEKLVTLPLTRQWTVVIWPPT